MKTICLAVCTLFSALAYAGDIPAGELLVVLGFYNQNATLTSPRVPAFEVIKPQVQNVQEEVFKLIAQENLKDTQAYDFLMALLKSEKGVERFRQRILNNFNSYELSPYHREIIKAYLIGEKLTEPDEKVFNKGTINPKEAFDQVIASIANLPRLFPNKEKLKNAMIFMRDMIMGKSADPCYGNDPNCVYGANYGLIDYLGNLLNNDQKFLIDSLRFYVRLKNYQLVHPHHGDFSVSDENIEPDQFPMALKATGGDPYQALRVISLYTHDQCCTPVVSKTGLQPFIELLNKISPTVGHDDTPESILHAPGALGGMTISRRLRYRFEELRQRSLALTGKEPSFMLGNYHIYGGLLTGGELLRHGYGVINGVKFSTFISQTLGYYYKKYTLTLWLTDDAKILWNQINQNEYLIPEQPYGWDDKRFQLALLSLDIQLAYLEHTTEQHRQGADLAYKIYQQ